MLKYSESPIIMKGGFMMGDALKNVIVETHLVCFCMNFLGECNG